MNTPVSHSIYKSSEEAAQAMRLDHYLSFNGDGNGRHAFVMRVRKTQAFVVQYRDEAKRVDIGDSPEMGRDDAIALARRYCRAA